MQRRRWCTSGAELICAYGELRGLRSCTTGVRYWPGIGTADLSAGGDWKARTGLRAARCMGDELQLNVAVCSSDLADASVAWN